MQQPGAPLAATSRSELDALMLQRAELSAQFEWAIGRQRQLAAQVQGSEANSAQSLQSRIKALDARSEQIQAEIGQLDVAIAEAIGRGVATNTEEAASPPWTVRGDVDSLMIAGAGVAIAVLVAVLWQFVRKNRLLTAHKFLTEQTGALERLQQSVDVIGVQVERISEHQRYVTRIFAENDLLAIRAGQAQSIPSAAPREHIPIYSSGEREVGNTKS